MSDDFPMRFMQPPQPVDDFSDFTRGEVAGMNADYRREQQFWRDEHQ